jgi:hypothetical protein
MMPSDILDLQYRHAMRRIKLQEEDGYSSVTLRADLNDIVLYCLRLQGYCCERYATEIIVTWTSRPPPTPILVQNA